jgi:hypothetical protein
MELRLPEDTHGPIGDGGAKFAPPSCHVFLYGFQGRISDLFEGLAWRPKAATCKLNTSCTHVYLYTYHLSICV